MDTPPKDAGKGVDCADCAVAAKPPPKMLTHAPGASAALEDTPFSAVKIRGWAATVCTAAQAPKKKTINARELIVRPPLSNHYSPARLAVTRTRAVSLEVSIRSGFGHYAVDFNRLLARFPHRLLYQKRETRALNRAQVRIVGIENSKSVGMVAVPNQNPISPDNQQLGAVATGPHVFSAIEFSDITGAAQPARRWPLVLRHPEYGACHALSEQGC
jgi:hypothetical protein